MNWVSIGSDNGLSPDQRQDITWTKAYLLSIRPVGTNFKEILIYNQSFVFTKNTFKNIVREMAVILSGGEGGGGS